MDIPKRQQPFFADIIMEQRSAPNSNEFLFPDEQPFKDSWSELDQMNSLYYFEDKRAGFLVYGDGHVLFFQNEQGGFHYKNYFQFPELEASSIRDNLIMNKRLITRLTKFDNLFVAND